MAERYHYTPYGEVTFMNASFVAHGTQTSTIGNDYLFTGRRLDPETGLYYFRNRYYHAQLGRFVTQDPLRYVDGGSLYAAYFVPGGVDPSGMLKGVLFNKCWSRCTIGLKNYFGKPKITSAICATCSLACAAKITKRNCYALVAKVISPGANATSADEAIAVVICEAIFSG